MSSELTVVFFLNPQDPQSGDYPVQLWQQGKPLATASARIDRQVLLEQEHTFSALNYGMALYDALFTGAVGRKYRELVGRAGSDGVVRVQLVIDPGAPELQALPWERLFHEFGDGEAPLAASARTPFSRFLISGAGDQPPVSASPLRLLLAVANPPNLPAGLQALDVAGEVEAMADLLADKPSQVVGTLIAGRSGLSNNLRSRLLEEGWVIYEGATSWQNIQRHLPGQHLLHILAHGQFMADKQHPGQGTAYLLLESDGASGGPAGSLARVADQEIAQGLAGVFPLPQLIFLAACESAKRLEKAASPFVGLGPRLVEAGVPAVVAMQDFVPIDLAHTLTGDFYRRLLDHGCVDRALNEARSLLFEDQKFEWAIPVLFLRLADGKILQRASQFQLRTIFDGLIEEYVGLFAGRDSEIGDLWAFMQEPLGGYLLVTAGAGLGKTALLANLVANDGDGLAYHFFTPFESESLKEDVFLRNVLEQMGPWYGVDDPPVGQLVDLRKRFDTFLGQSPQGNCTVLLDGLDEVTGWKLSRYLTRRLPPGLHFILSVRDVDQNPAVKMAEYGLPDQQVRSMPLIGLSREGVQAVLRAAGVHASTFADTSALLDEVMRVTAYEKTKPELGADPFFVRFLAQDAASGDLKPAEMLELPAEMAAYLDRWWEMVRAQFGEEGDRKKREQAMVDLAGTLAVALGPIGTADLERMHASLVSDVEQDFVTTVVRAVNRIVVRDRHGDYTLLHPRLRDYLRQKMKTGIYGQKLLQDCAKWQEHQSPYALSFYVRHLAEVAEAETQVGERHALIERMVRLVTNEQFQDTHIAQVQDLHALMADLELTLQMVATDEDPRALSLLVETARALVRFRRERLRPEPLFELARQGDVMAARRMLDLFEVDRKWHQATLLEIAWLAKDQDLYREIESEIAGLPEDDQRQVLLQWIKADLEDSDLPPSHLPDAQEEVALRSLLDVAGGISPEADVSPELLAQGLVGYENLLGDPNLLDDADEVSDDMFLSYYVGPRLVAFAAEQPGAGERYLREYLLFHSVYSYAVYRLGSLWALLPAVLQHPDSVWVKEKVQELAITALGGAGVAFEEGLPLAVLALQSQTGIATAAQELADLVAKTWQEVEQLSPESGQGDTWGRYKRLLATLAELKAHLSVQMEYDFTALLERALDIHYGYAGYQAPTCLTLAEAIRVCRPEHEQLWVSWMLESAQLAAHNIQEGTFCARTTARVNAMRAHWWPETDLDVAAHSEALRANSQFQTFASLHYGDHQYQGRGQPPQSWPLPRRVAEANTLFSLADAYQRGLPEFLQLNPRWEPEQIIPAGEQVYVPDPGLVPLLAARLAAEALANGALSKDERVAIIRSLVPVAAANATALDTVLARLLLAQAPSDPAILDRLAQLAPLPQEPPGAIRGTLTVAEP